MKKILIYYVVSIFIVCTQGGRVHAVFDATQEEYFPLLIPTQEQVQQERIYLNTYDQVVEELELPKYQEKSDTDIDILHNKKQSIPLILPNIMLLPEFLPETGANIEI